MALKAGSKNTGSDYANSMAAAMENAFIQEWPKIMGSEPLPPPDDAMRLLFIAVAQGVVRHLVNNPTSFSVQITDVHGNTRTGNVNSISPTGTLY